MQPTQSLYCIGQGLFKGSPCMQPTVCASLQLNRERLVQWSDCQGAKAELHPCVIFELLYTGLNLPQVVLKSHDESYVMIYVIF